jgi:hypothetical protein
MIGLPSASILVHAQAVCLSVEKDLNKGVAPCAETRTMWSVPRYRFDVTADRCWRQAGALPDRRERALVQRVQFRRDLIFAVSFAATFSWLPKIGRFGQRYRRNRFGDREGFSENGHNDGPLIAIDEFRGLHGGLR